MTPALIIRKFTNSEIGVLEALRLSDAIGEPARNANQALLLAMRIPATLGYHANHAKSRQEIKSLVWGASL